MPEYLTFGLGAVVGALISVMGQLALKWYNDHQKKDSLRAGYVAEIKHNQRSFAFLNSSEVPFRAIKKFYTPHTDFHKTNMSDLRLLSQEEIEAII